MQIGIVLTERTHRNSRRARAVARLERRDDRGADGRMRLGQDGRRRGAGCGSRLAVLRRRRFSSARERREDGAGTPLVDADRWPWLDRLAAEMEAVNDRGGDAVLACSALKQVVPRPPRSRRRCPLRLPQGRPRHDRRTARVASHRYMPATLLASQFATLEEPADAIVVDVRDTIPEQVAKIRAALGRRQRGCMNDKTKDTGPPRAPAIWDAIRANSWARSTRRCSARRRCCFRRCRSRAGGASASTTASATDCTGCRRSPTCRTPSRRSRARTPRSRCRRA